MVEKSGDRPRENVYMLNKTMLEINTDTRSVYQSEQQNLAEIQ